MSIKTLQSDTSIIILPADKDDDSVAINKLKYPTKLASVHKDGSYSKIKKNLTLKTETKLSQILNKNNDYFAVDKYRQLTQYYSKLRHIYSFPLHNNSGIHR